MPDARKTGLRNACLAAALGCGLFASPHQGGAAPDWDLVDLRSQLTELSRELRTNEDLRSQSVTEIVADLGIRELASLSPPPRRAAIADEPAVFAWTDERHALSAMAQIYGGSNNRKVLEAGRPDDYEALEITSGVLTLAQLRDRLAARHLGRETDTGHDVLRVPLVIGPDARLFLGEGEILKLSNDDGAYIVSFGRIEVVGGEISASRKMDEATEEFAPFVVSVGSGTVMVSGATFRNLGFGFTAKFAGFSILSHPSMLPNRRNVVENSRFDNLVTLVTSGVRHVEVRGNRFFDMRRNPILISRSPNAVVEGNLFSGDSPTNAIRVANGSGDSRLSHNIVLEGSRAGLLVSSGSDNVIVANNVIWRRDGGGVKLFNVRCGRIEDNLILDDRQKGIEVRSSVASHVSGNRIIGNANAAVWVSANRPDNVTYLIGNLIRENGSGLSTASGGNVAMQDNDLSNQFPRFLDGDVTHHFRAIVADMTGRTPLLLSARGVEPIDGLRTGACNS